MLDNSACVYYDPLKSRLTLARGTDSAPTLTLDPHPSPPSPLPHPHPHPNQVHGTDSMRKFIAYLLLKCNYADNSHVQENKGHYTGTTHAETAL